MREYPVLNGFQCITITMCCLLISSCGAFGIKLPSREFGQYPLLPSVSKDARYPGAVGFLNSSAYLMTSLDTTQIKNAPDLKGKNSILYSKISRSIVKSYNYSIDSRSSVIVDGYAFIVNNKNQFIAVELSTGMERIIPVSDIKTPIISSVTNHSFIYKDRVYIFLSDVILVYKSADLIQNIAPKPIWFLEKSHDFIAFNEASGDLFYTSRELLSDGNHANAFISRFDYNGKEISIYKVLENLPAAYAYLSIAVKGDYIYTLGGGNMQLKKYDLQNKLIWENLGYICPKGSTPIPSSLINYQNTLLAMPSGDSCFSAWDTETGKIRWGFQSPNGFSFANKPLLLNNILYAANQYMWALDFDTGKILAVSEENASTQGETGTPQYDVASNQIILWGTELQFYKPLKY